jgi:arylsulfatase A-like enzyme
MKNFIPLGLLVAASACTTGEKKSPNVLFIMIDDLRPALGTYNYPGMHTPVLDQLASEGVQFNRAYCNVPVCGASRASLLTSIRPKYPDRFINHASWAEKDAAGIISLPEYLKNNGYTTISNGKVFHHLFDMATSWSETPWWPDTSTVINYMDIDWIDSSSLAFTNKETGAGPYFECSTVDDSLYFDSKVTAKSIKDMKRLSETGKPFFLAVGYHKPHLPFNAHKRYYDLYDSIEIATNRFTPANLPNQVKNSREIFIYGRLDHYNSTEFHYEARRAYYACVSYIDDQVKILLNSLKELGLEENTIIVVLGDHGWNLGEHDYWGKHNIFHNALHVPLIIKAPGIKPGKTDKLVEYVDIYPTLCQLSDLEIPEHVHGSSMVPLMKGKSKEWKNTAFCEWQGARTVLTERYSYSYWFQEKDKGANCLFDHLTDKEENENVAVKPEYATVVSEHQQLIDDLYLNLK